MVKSERVVGCNQVTVELSSVNGFGAISTSVWAMEYGMMRQNAVCVSFNTKLLTWLELSPEFRLLFFNFKQVAHSDVKLSGSTETQKLL